MTLTGVGAMNSPRFAPAGLLVEHDGARLLIDGGRDAAGDLDLDAWLVTDDRSELVREIRLAARARGIDAGVGHFSSPNLTVEPLPVSHTSHDTYGYLIQAEQHRIVWAPEFYVFPEWAAGCDLMFAEAAAWDRPVHFAGKVGGHASALDVSREAHARHVERLVFAHIGRPTIRAMDRGLKPRFGEYGRDRARFEPRRWRG